MKAAPGRHAEFPPTHWTLVAEASGPDNEGALSRLYQSYWQPLHAQALRFGVREEDVADVLQDLFVALFTSGSLARAKAVHGRFRSYLLGALRNFLNHRRSWIEAEKRGGGRALISIDDLDLAAPLDDHAFDADWARALIATALRRFESEQGATDESRASFAVLGTMALGEAPESLHDAAARLGITVPAVKSRLFRLRERFREVVREEVSRTVSSSSECDDELRYLCAVLGKVDGVPALA